MQNYQASVLVNLRPSVLDPAGEATRSAASRLGVDGITQLRIGKVVSLEIKAVSYTHLTLPTILLV